MSEADADRALWEEFASGRGAGRDGPLDEFVESEGLTALGAVNALLDFFLGTGAGEDPWIDGDVAADASYSSAAATRESALGTSTSSKLTHGSIIVIVKDEVVRV